MLMVHVLGWPDNCIKIPKDYFKFNKKKEWFNRQDVKDIIKEIDDSIAVKDEYIESPMFGGMSPDRLSHGCKTVILACVIPDINVYASRCGDNCFPILNRLAQNRNIDITLHHLPRMPKDIHAIFVDSGVEVKNNKQFIAEYLKVTESIPRDMNLSKLTDR